MPSVPATPNNSASSTTPSTQENAPSTDSWSGDSYSGNHSYPGSDSYSGNDSYYDSAEEYEKSYDYAPSTSPQSAWRSGDSMPINGGAPQISDEELHSSPMIMTRPDTRTSNARQDVQIQKPTVENAYPTTRKPAFSMTPTQGDRGFSTPNSRQESHDERDIVIVRPRRAVVPSRPIVPENRDDSQFGRSTESPVHSRPESRPTSPNIAPPEKIPTQLPPPEPSTRPIGPINSQDGRKV
ncbi:MAG: hypothetical protein Q4C70_09610 [Planctomycetia bacterium]|nr:hypothetical protein [Planctomycetia bacterium]